MRRRTLCIAAAAVWLMLGRQGRPGTGVLPLQEQRRCQERTQSTVNAGRPDGSVEASARDMSGGWERAIRRVADPNLQARRLDCRRPKRQQTWKMIGRS
jgi:hypothetical protein